MRRIDIDYRRRARFGPVGLIFLVLALILLAFAWLHQSRLTRELAELNYRIDTLYRHQRAESFTMATHYAIPPERLKAINLAITSLNTPWGHLFDTLERNLSKDVALLSIEPNIALSLESGTGAHQVRMVAETGSPSSMTGFVERLLKDPFFQDVVLQRHHIEDTLPGRPYRFTVEARWGSKP